jgi:teichuronic acid biosynthesis glycosyltransferase TuaC
MNVLFVTSGNSKDFEIAPFVKDQGESLREAGVEIEYFTVRGKGIRGYIKGGFALRRFLEGKHFDLIHAHYVLSGWSAVIGSGKIPVVLSLMGSDAYGEYVGEKKVQLTSRFSTLLTWMIQPFIKAIICKSEFIQRFVYRKKISSVIPNGINLDHFKPENAVSRSALGLSENKRYILFLGDRNDKRKNFHLAQTAVNYINDPAIELINPYPVSHTIIPHYINASNVLILTSFMEGSPNVVKEAMACNCPVVATDVGDISWLFGNEPGHFITGVDAEDAVDKIKAALHFSEKHGRTRGRERIMELGLDAESVAGRVLAVYERVLER